MSLKLSCIPLIYYKELVDARSMRVVDWIRLAAGLHLDAIELTDSVLSPYAPSEMRNIREELERHDLLVDQLDNVSDYVHADPNVRRAAMDDLARQIEAAAFLGAQYIRVTVGQAQHGLPLEGAIERFRSCMEGFFESAQQAGVTLLIENHYKYYYWEHPDFTFKSADFLSFAAALRDTPIRINFDCANQIMAGEAPLPVLEAIKDRVAHVHANDRARAGQYAHSIVGEGITPLREIFQILMAAGYAGYISLEYNGEEGLTGMTRSLGAIRRIWRETQQRSELTDDLAAGSSHSCFANLN